MMTAMANINKIKIGVALLLFLSVMAAKGGSIYIQKMPVHQWVEIVLQNEYRLNEDKAIAIGGYVTNASQRYGVPPEIIIAMMSVESKFDYNAHSYCHAIGLMQVRPDVWGGTSPHNIHNRRENVLAGAWVLRNYRDQLGSYPSAIKAYNVGITKFRQGKAHESSAEYLEKVEKQRKLIITKYPKLITSI